MNARPMAESQRWESGSPGRACRPSGPASRAGSLTLYLAAGHLRTVALPFGRVLRQRQHSRRRRYQCLGNVFPVSRGGNGQGPYPEQAPGPDERFLFRRARDAVPAGSSWDRGGSVSGFLVDPGGDLVTGRLPKSVAGILAALPGQKTTS